MNTIAQPYRTTCIPKENRIDTFIPPEYVGQEVEIVICPIYAENKHDIANAKKKARGSLHKYANIDLISSEKGAWEKAIAEKYARQ
jgi:hypothetical protein